MDLITTQRLSRTLTLLPNRTQRVYFRGSYISILSNTATEDVLVCADSGTTSPVEANTGFPTVKIVQDANGNLQIVPAIFNYVEFTNTSNSETMVIEYLLSLGTPDDNRTVIRGYIQMDLSAPVMETPPALIVPDSECVILPSNQLIKERMVTNTGDAVIWFGDENTNPATARGTPIYPQGSAIINCWGVVYFMAETGGSRLSVNHIMKV